MPEDPKRFGALPRLLLVWNGYGAIVTLLCVLLFERSAWADIFLYFVMSWVLSLPFTALAVAVLVWRSRRDTMTGELLLNSFVAFLVWGVLTFLILSVGLIAAMQVDKK